MAIKRLPSELAFLRNHYGYGYGDTPADTPVEDYNDDFYAYDCSCMSKSDSVECNECMDTGITKVNHHSLCRCQKKCDNCSNIRN